MLKRFITMTLIAGMLMCSFAGCSTAQTEAPAPDAAPSQESPADKDDQTENNSAPDDSVDYIDTVSSTDEPIDAAETTLTFIGHASVKLKTKDGTVIFIDPQQYSPDAYNDEADFILVTHGHSDHTPGSQVKLKDDGVQITWKEALIDGEYQTFEYDNVKIEAVKMGGNSNHAIGSGVGYIVTIDDISIYHAGDSSNHEELHYIADYDIDYALYPIDGVYNMDADEATELANIIGAKNNIPIHASNVNPNVDKRDRFTPSGRLIIEDQETIVLIND